MLLLFARRIGDLQIDSGISEIHRWASLGDPRLVQLLVS